MAFMFLNKRERDVLKAVRALDADDRGNLSVMLKNGGKAAEKDSINELRRALTLSHRKF